MLRRALKEDCGFPAVFREDIPVRRGGTERNVKWLAEAGISGREEETGRRWYAIAQEGHEQEETKLAFEVQEVFKWCISAYEQL